jgi:hypothetical protein
MLSPKVIFLIFMNYNNIILDCIKLITLSFNNVETTNSLV